MQKFDSRDLDAIDFDEVLARLQRGIDSLTLEGTASIPEADVLRCRYKSKRFNIKFDLAYGVCIEALDGLADHELKDIADLLQCFS